MDTPLLVGEETALEPGSDAVWFTFPGAWHDIGRFYRADGRFSGIYANVITPCRFWPGGVWQTTDLFLDVWVPSREGSPRPDEARVEDRDELEVAVDRGALEPWLAHRAGQEAHRIMAAVRNGRWPPPVVERWTREVARVYSSAT